MEAEQILAVLDKQKFADWYNSGGSFDRYITSEEPEMTKEMILQEIRQLFKCD